MIFQNIQVSKVYEQSGRVEMSTNAYLSDRRIVMSNGIASRQNEDNSIAMLAAQRQLYRDAKKCNTVLVALSVWIPFALSVILLFIPENTEWRYASYILSIVSMVFSFAIDKYIEQKKQLAAFIQQKLDVYVYEMPWDKRIFGRDKNVDHEIATHSKKILNNQQEQKQLKDWYTPGVDKKNAIDGILACQRENLGWDVGLRKRFKFVSITLIIILFAAIFAMGLWKNERIIELLWRVAFITPMLKWLLDTIKKLNKDISTLQELDNDINNNETKTMEDLQDYPYLSFEQGEHNSFYYSEEMFSTEVRSKNIRVRDRATLFNLLIGLNGYTISSGVIDKELNGENIIAVPLAEEGEMHIGYVTHKKTKPSRLGAIYLEALKRHAQ